MGCISSKAFSISSSLNEERRLDSQRIANSVSNKPQSRRFNSNTISRLGAMPANTDTDKPESSTSCHWFPEHVVSSSLARQNSFGFEDDSCSECRIQSRSFHSVEEHNDLVNGSWSSEICRFQQRDFDDGSGNKLHLVSKSVFNTFYHIEKKNSDFKTLQAECLQNDFLPESRIPSSNNIKSKSGQENKEETSVHQSDVSESVFQGGNTNEKGYKRKIAAKRLKSLKIPSDIEYPLVASLKEWLPEGGIESSVSCAMPKFSSYSVKTCCNVNESGEDSISSPKLVSSFTECLQSLESGEQNCFKQIMDSLGVEGGEANQSQEKTSPKMEANEG